MTTRLAIIGLVSGFVFMLTACSGSADELTAASAKQKIASAEISCESLDEQDLGAILQGDEASSQGALLVCSDEGSTFGLGIFDRADGINSFLELVCASTQDEENLEQLKTYTLLWGPNWFADATSNPELTGSLQKALGGEILSLFDRCTA